MLPLVPPMGDRQLLCPQGDVVEVARGQAGIDLAIQKHIMQPINLAAMVQGSTGLLGPNRAPWLACPYGKLYFEPAIPPSSPDPRASVNPSGRRGLVGANTAPSKGASREVIDLANSRTANTPVAQSETHGACRQWPKNFERSIVGQKNLARRGCIVCRRFLILSALALVGRFRGSSYACPGFSGVSAPHIA